MHSFPATPTAAAAAALVVSLVTAGTAAARDPPDIVWQVQAGPAVAFSSDGHALVAGNTLRDAADGRLLETYALHPIGNGVASVAIAPDGGLVAIGVRSYNQNLDLFDAASGTPLAGRISAHANGTFSVAFSPVAPLLASGGADGTAKLWQLPDMGLLRTLGGGSGYRPRVFDVAFSPDGESLAVAGEGGVEVFRTADGMLLRTLEGSVETLGVAWSPDGSLIAAGSDAVDMQGQCADCTIKLWRAADGTPVRTIAGTDDGVVALGFSPDGAWIITGSGDRTVDGLVRFLRVDDGSEALRFGQDGGYVTDVAWSPDGDLFAFARSDGVVTVARNPFGGDACAVTLTPTQARFLHGGGVGTIGIRTGAGCAWRARSDAGWVRLVREEGTGSAAVAYSVGADEAGTRSATVTVGDQVLRIEQKGSVPAGVAPHP